MDFTHEFFSFQPAEFGVFALNLRFASLQRIDRMPRCRRLPNDSFDLAQRNRRIPKMLSDCGSRTMSASCCRDLQICKCMAMETCAAVLTGKTTGWSHQHKTQVGMRGQLIGRLCVRDLYGHDPPQTSFAEAVPLLGFATQLGRLIDSQVVQRERPPVVVWRG